MVQSSSSVQVRVMPFDEYSCADFPSSRIRGHLVELCCAFPTQTYLQFPVSPCTLQVDPGIICPRHHMLVSVFICLLCTQRLFLGCPKLPDLGISSLTLPAGSFLYAQYRSLLFSRGPHAIGRDCVNAGAADGCRKKKRNCESFFGPLLVRFNGKGGYWAVCAGVPG